MCSTCEVYSHNCLEEEVSVVVCAVDNQDKEDSREVGSEDLAQNLATKDDTDDDS